MKELFTESRYLKMAAAAIAAVMVICAIAGRFYAFGSGPSEEELMEIEKSGAKIAVPFDKYREIASIKVREAQQPENLRTTSGKS